MTILRRIAAAGALALTMLGLSVPAASAGEDERINVAGGSAQFDHHGEHLWAFASNPSHKSDGVRAYLDWRDAEGRHTESATSFANQDNGHTNLSIREGTTVTLSVCYLDIEDGAVHVTQCSLGQRAEA